MIEILGIVPQEYNPYWYGFRYFEIITGSTHLAMMIAVLGGTWLNWRFWKLMFGDPFGRRGFL